MGFNKRYINERLIRTIIREEGFQSLINYIKKPDALIIEDKFSSEICGIINDTEENKILIKLLEKTDLYGTNDTETLL